jgi:hypothetical protein
MDRRNTRRAVVAVALTGATILVGVAVPTGAAGARGKGSHCSVQNAGGGPSSVALGGWSYDVNFVCPFKLSSFTVRTNKRLRAGVDKGGLTVPYADAELKNGQQVNFTCKDTSTKSFKCTLSPALPAHIGVGDGFDSSTSCTNTSRGDLQADLAVNGKTTRVSFNGKTTNGSLTGGCG